MILEMKSVMDDNVIHLTEDIMTNLKTEVSDVREALLTKFPDKEFPNILPNLNPEQIIPPDALFEIELGPNPDDNIYGDYGTTIRADRGVPYSLVLAKWIGIQVDVETPFIEEILLWVQKINNNEHVPMQNSQWRHDFFQKRRALLKQKLIKVLQKEIMDLILISQHYKDGTLMERTGWFTFWEAFFQRKVLNEANCQLE